MKIIFTSFEKKTINSLPRILFPGNMIVIDKAEDTDAAVEYLLGQDILGVDTEKFLQGYALPGIAAAGEYPRYLLSLPPASHGYDTSHHPIPGG